MNRRFIFIACLVGLFILQLSEVTFAQPILYDFRINQAQGQLPNLKIYADVVGADDLPAKGLKPEYFKAKIGDSQLSVNKITAFEDSGEGIGYVLLVDVSKSLSARRFDQIRETLSTFVDSMSGLDQGALLTFGSDVKLLQEFTQDKGKLKSIIAGLVPQDEDTAFYAGLDKALEVSRQAPKAVPTRRVILTLTDGVDDIAKGASKADILARLETDATPLYIIGYMPATPNGAELDAIKAMSDFAGISGGRYYDGRTRDWRSIYFSIMRTIREAFVLELSATSFRSDGSAYRLEMSVTGSNKALNADRKLIIPAGGPMETGPVANANSGEQDKNKAGLASWILWVAGVIALLVIAALILVWIKRKNPASASVAPMKPVIDSKVAAEKMEIDSAPVTATVVDTRTEADTIIAPSGVLIRLTKLSEGPPPNQFDIDVVDRVIIGNSPSASHLVFESDPLMAPAHCEIFFENGFIYLQDLGSPSGTFINGVAILDRRHRVEESDILKIGGTEIRLSFPLPE